MPLTQVLEPPVSEFACCDLDRRLTTDECPSRPSSDRQPRTGLIVFPSPPGAVRPSVLRCIISA